MPRGQRKSETYNARVRVTVGTGRPASGHAELDEPQRGGEGFRERGKRVSVRRTTDRRSKVLKMYAALGGVLE